MRSARSTRAHGSRTHSEEALAVALRSTRERPPAVWIARATGRGRFVQADGLDRATFPPSSLRGLDRSGRDGADEADHRR